MELAATGELVRALPSLGQLPLAIAAWTFAVLLGLQLGRALQAAVRQTRRMHAVPCAGCRFFDDNPYLPCAIRPSEANTPAAIGCRDYQPRRAIDAAPPSPVRQPR